MWRTLPTFKPSRQPAVLGTLPRGIMQDTSVIKVTFRYLNPHRRTEGSRDVYLVLDRLAFRLVFGGHLGVESDFRRGSVVPVLSEHRDVSPLERALQLFLG